MLIKAGREGDPSDNRRARRRQSILRASGLAVVGRILGLAVGLVSLPLTVRYLGAERYGIWVTISTFLSFLSFTDFGLANSLTNALGRAYGQGEHAVARRYVSSAFCLLSLVGLVLLVAAILFTPYLSAWIFPKFDGREAESALLIGFVIFALNFPLLVINRVLAAYQESVLANAWGIAANLANFGAILIAIWSRASLPWLVLGCSGLGLVCNLVCGIWLFGWHKPWLRPSRGSINRDVTRSLCSVGGKFLLINAGWMVNSQSDNLVIAHYLGSREVTPFSVTFQLFAAATVLQSLLIPSLGPAYTEAYASGDFLWIRRAMLSHLRVSLSTTVLLVIVFVSFGIPIIRSWAGAAAVPPFSLLLWMSLWSLMQSNLHVFGCLLNAIEQLGTTMVCSTVTAVVNVVLSIALVHAFGISGVMAATVLAFVFFDYLPIGRQIILLLREFADPTRNTSRVAN